MLNSAGAARREELALIEFDLDCLMTAGAVYAGQPAYLPAHECHACVVVHLQLVTENPIANTITVVGRIPRPYSNQECQNPFQNRPSYISPGEPPTHVKTSQSPCLLISRINVWYELGILGSSIFSPLNTDCFAPVTS